MIASTIILVTHMLLWSSFMPPLHSFPDPHACTHICIPRCTPSWTNSSWPARSKRQASERFWSAFGTCRRMRRPRRSKAGSRIGQGEKEKRNASKRENKRKQQPPRFCKKESNKSCEAEASAEKTSSWREGSGSETNLLCSFWGSFVSTARPQWDIDGGPVSLLSRTLTACFVLSILLR